MFDAVELRRDDGDSSRSGIWLRLRFSTTDCGRILWANERLFDGSSGVACVMHSPILDTALQVSDENVVNCRDNNDGINDHQLITYKI